MKNKLKKLLSLLLVAAMVIIMSACGKEETTPASTDTQSEETPEQVSYDTAAENVKKSETVYVNLDPDGNITGKVVTDWLHTDKAETYIDDVSNLENIVNVKSNILPIKSDDGTLRWNMPTTDLYYRGTTDRELPISFGIDYYLDGKKLSAQEIAGKKGHVKIVVTMNNSSLKEVTVGGKKETIYTPFIVAGGLVLSESSFSNVNVENGKTIGDGTKEIALLIGTPGLKESLKLSDELLKQLGDFDFSSTYTISMDTEKFEISNMLFAVLPLSAIITGIGDTLPGTVADVKDQLGKIQTVIDKLNSMNVAELMTNLFSNTDKLSELTASISKVTTVYNNNKALLDVIEKYMTEENMSALKKFVNDTKDVDLDEVIDLLSNPVLQRFFKQLPTLANDMKAVEPIIKGLSDDLSDPAVKKAVDELPQTVATLKELKETLDSNQELFEVLGNTFDEKTMTDLEEIMDSLDGMIDKDTISKYAGLIDNADELIERVQEWIKAGKEYNLFTVAKDKAETSVMFIYETSPINAPSEKVESSEDESGLSENPIKTWLKNLFKNDN